MHKSITLARVNEAAKRRITSLDNPGFCTLCGHEHDGCEPDATDIECEACGENTVCGAEEILLMIT